MRGCCTKNKQTKITDIDIDGVIKELESWFQRNDLIINVGKTVVMSCHSRKKKVSKKTSSYLQ